MLAFDRRSWLVSQLCDVFTEDWDPRVARAGAEDLAAQGFSTHIAVALPWAHFYAGGAPAVEEGQLFPQDGSPPADCTILVQKSPRDPLDLDALR